MNEHQKTVSLVLGSGSARGLAHIGVIDVLIARGYKIESISGCSIGALVGGIYATGKISLYKRWLKGLDKTSVFKLLDFSFDRSGIFKGERVIDELLAIVGDYQIEDLPIKYTAVASDIDREKEIWFTEGSLFEAIRASISVPTIFTPHNYRSMNLVDGGLLNPVPVAPTAGDNTDLIVAVNLNARTRTANQKNLDEGIETEENIVDSRWQSRISKFVDRFASDKGSQFFASSERLNLMDMMTRSIDIMQNTIAHSKMSSYRPDVLIEVPRDLANMFDYYRSEMLINYGAALTEHALDVWEGRQERLNHHRS